jgi:hypothetical protein
VTEQPPAEQQPGSATKGVVDRASAEKVDSMADVVITDWRSDLELKRDYARWALIGMAVQVALADAAFGIYAFSKGWDKVPDGVMIAWLSATAVQVAAVTLAVARGLFPGNAR